MTKVKGNFKETNHTLIQITRGIAYSTLEFVFSVEWLRLSSDDCKKIADDLIRSNIGSREYKNRIGTGNLQSYANCL